MEVNIDEKMKKSNLFSSFSSTLEYPLSLESEISLQNALIYPLSERKKYN